MSVVRHQNQVESFYIFLKTDIGIKQFKKIYYILFCILGNNRHILNRRFSKT